MGDLHGKAGFSFSVRPKITPFFGYQLQFDRSTLLFIT